ncbi:MAG: hypothetical protein ACLRXC_06280 [[Clostridium] leptum]
MENGDCYGKTGSLPVLYCRQPPSVPAGRGDSAEKVRKNVEKAEDERAATGGSAVIQAMEADGAGKFIPVALKDGVPAKD